MPKWEHLGLQCVKNHIIYSLVTNNTPSHHCNRILHQVPFKRLVKYCHHYRWDTLWISDLIRGGCFLILMNWMVYICPNFAACHLCLVKRHLRVGYTTKTQEDTLKLCFLSLNQHFIVRNQQLSPKDQKIELEIFHAQGFAHWEHFILNSYWYLS